MNANMSVKRRTKRHEKSGFVGLQVESVFLRCAHYLLLIFVCIIIVTPILIVLNTSLKSNAEFMHSTGVFQLPENILNFSNYMEVLEKGRMLNGYKNTLILCIVSGLGSVMLSSMTAYAVGRFNFKSNKYVLGAFVISTMIPQITTQVATFQIIKGMGLYNTIYSALLLYLAASVLYLYIFLQFIDKIPYELDESAMIDGASHLKIFFTIILPLMRPAVITVLILKFIEIYNDMFIPFLYMPSSNLRTVTTSLMKFRNDKVSQWNTMSAAIVLVMIPTLLAYIFLQKYILSGITSGSVKE